jgi:hypothetical protein
MELFIKIIASCYFMYLLHILVPKIDISVQQHITSNVLVKIAT